MTDKERIRFLEEKLAISFKDYLILEKLFGISLDALELIELCNSEMAMRDVAAEAIIKIKRINA